MARTEGDAQGDEGGTGTQGDSSGADGPDTVAWDEGVVVANEFASVKVWLDRRGNGPRLLVEDLESGDRVYLDPLELASFCYATDADRAGWLRVGPYRDDRR